MVDIFHVLLHKATWLQEQLTLLLTPVVLHVVPRMVRQNLRLPLAEPVTANQNLLPAEQATINPLLPVVPQKEIAKLKHQPAVPHAELKSEDFCSRS
jgi:hypothetical protein